MKECIKKSGFAMGKSGGEDVKGKTRLKERSVEVEDVDVYQIRQKYNLTQLKFSKTLGFSLRTLQQWNKSVVGHTVPHLFF